MSMHISRRSSDDSEELQELIDKFDLELWLDDEGVDYSLTSGSSGEQINIKTCPRCGGSSNKVFLNRETGLGNCFHGSCVGEPGFNKFTFIKHYTGETGKVVVDIFKDQAEQHGWRPKREKKAVTVTIPEHIKLPDNYALPIGERNIKYLTQRNITKESTKYFDLRYCKEGKYWYDDLVKEKRAYQKYDQRVIIPIYDETGKLVTFQGRDITKTADRKYLFPPMLPSTGRYLYNAHNVDTKSVVMGEGVFDVIAIHQALKQYKLDSELTAIGSFGISFATGENQQLSVLNKLIEKGVESLTFAWDGSIKAISQAMRYALIVQSRTSIEIKVALLPLDKDPNEISPSALINAIALAKPITKHMYLEYRLRNRAALAK